jgi:hypothetical protein
LEPEWSLNCNEGDVAIVLPLRVLRDHRRPKTVVVKDAKSRDVGLIHQRNGLWMNYPSEEANRLLAPVPIGPFLTMESAFEAFRTALGDVSQ